MLICDILYSSVKVLLCKVEFVRGDHRKDPRCKLLETKNQLDDRSENKVYGARAKVAFVNNLVLSFRLTIFMQNHGYRRGDYIPSLCIAFRLLLCSANTYYEITVQ